MGHFDDDDIDPEDPLCYPDGEGGWIDLRGDYPEDEDDEDDEDFLVDG